MIHTYDALFLGGRWTPPETDERIDVHSACTEELIGSVPAGIEPDIDAAVAAARRAFDDPTGWAHWDPAARASAMGRLAAALRSRAEDTATRVSAQNGMPIRLARRSEAVAPAQLLDYYAHLAPQTPTEERRASLVTGTSLIRRQPVGVVAAIVPWNFPQSLTFFKLAPALAAGCTVVIKPAPETVLDAFLLAEAVEEANLPPGVINIVPGGRHTGNYLVSHPSVDKVAFTGSTDAGREIGAACGRLLRPVTLELGGKSAAIVLDDVDLPAGLPGLFAACLLNNGQTCYLSTRILAPRGRYGEVVDAITDLARSLRIGDPLDPSTQVGPLVSARQRERVETYIAKGVAEGGRVTTGGGRPADFDRGWFVQPTVFADLDNNAVVAREEIFGPVLTVIEYTDLDDAVRIANDSEYGLGGSVWTSDPQRGLAVAGRVQTGSIGINLFTLDPGAPFGGVKASGLGRELGPEGLAAYQQFKTLYLPSSP